MNISPSICIFSCSDPSLIDFQYKRLEGCYLGHIEPAYLALAELEHRVAALCWADDQECYLYSGADRYTWLKYHDGRQHALGKLRQVTRQLAEAHGSYTYDPETGIYWMAGK